MDIATGLAYRRGMDSVTPSHQITLPRDVPPAQADAGSEAPLAFLREPPAGPCGSTSRRVFLRRCGLSLAALGLLAALPRRSAAQTSAAAAPAFFSPAQRALFAAVSAVLLGGLLPVADPERRAAIAEVVQGADRYMTRLVDYSQAEAREVLELLGFAPVRMLVGGVWARWEDAAPEDVAAFLENFRTSRFGLKRRIYQFLHELSAVGWFGAPRAWPAVGYPGPPAVTRPMDQPWPARRT